MSILFSVIGLLIMLAIFAGVIVLVVFLARKAGLVKAVDRKTVEGEITENSVKVYLGNFQWIQKSMVWRFFLVALLIGFMTTPLSMVESVVKERSHMYTDVKSNVAATWGRLQNLGGPSLLIPYTERFDSIEVLTDKDGNERKKNKTVYKHRTAIVLPDELNIDVTLMAHTRVRSIYEALVYAADITIQGEFKRPYLSELSNNIEKIHWQRAWLSLGMSDTQAINRVSALSWNGVTTDFEPGTKITDFVPNGFHAPLDLSEQSRNAESTTSANYPFSMDININGSQGFYFRPFGKTTNVHISSDWPHPSFQGNVLPDEHNIQHDGFSASWSVPHLARNYPQFWTLEIQEFDIDEFSAGVNLFESISLYSQITRAIKYGVLFLVLTYITFLLFEMGIGQRLHFIQYGVIGLALSMFYLTLLSMAEHTGFFKAYVSAAVIIISMISVYVLSALGSLGRTATISLLLVGLYSMLFTLLSLEDYALLAGAVLLLVALAAMMYLTRNVGKPVAS